MYTKNTIKFEFILLLPNLILVRISYSSNRPYSGLNLLLNKLKTGGRTKNKKVIHRHGDTQASVCVAFGL